MKLQILSDIHLEFHGKMPDISQSDLLIIAGDLHIGALGEEILQKWSEINPILYILGNHEFYNNDYDQVLNIWKSFTHPKIHFLHNQKIIVDGVRFLGSTLWTDVNYNNKIDRANIREGIADYLVIRKNNQIITPTDTYQWFQDAYRWLESELNSPYTGPTVVVTHHLPSYSSVSPKYKNDSYNAAFAAHCDDLIHQYSPTLWIHGHTHDSFDYMIGKTRIICNPMGYPHEINPNFKENLIIDV